MLCVQVILVNKMDLPHVRERWPQLKAELVKLVGHGRVDAISAAANLNLMPVCVSTCMRVRVYEFEYVRSECLDAGVSL